MESASRVMVQLSGLYLRVSRVGQNPQGTAWPELTKELQLGSWAMHSCGSSRHVLAQPAGMDGELIGPHSCSTS